jgi:hypothetical protein
MKKKIGFAVLLGMVLALGAFGQAAAGVDPQPFQPKADKAAGVDPTPFQPGISNVTLKNGLRAEIKGGRMFLIGADGKQSPAKDGTYPLMDGKKIKVLNGKAIIVQ